MYVASAIAFASSVSGAVSSRVSCFRVNAAQVWGATGGDERGTAVSWGRAEQAKRAGAGPRGAALAPGSCRARRRGSPPSPGR